MNYALVAFVPLICLLALGCSNPPCSSMVANPQSAAQTESAKRDAESLEALRVYSIPAETSITRLHYLYMSGKDQRPVWSVEGRVHNDAIHDVRSAIVRISITSVDGLNVFDTAEVAVADVPFATSKGFKQEVHLLVPTRKWIMTSDVVHAQFEGSN